MTQARIRRPLLLCACCVGAARAAAAQCPDGTPPPCGRPAAPRVGSVAVLYFAARDSADAYLADGLTEDLTTLLARSPGVMVKPSSTVRVAQRRQPNAPARSLGRTLNVRYVVQGTLRRAADHVRLNVQVVEAAADVSVWGETYDRTAQQLLDLPGELAEEVARRVSGPGAPATGPAPGIRRAVWRTENAAALDHFRKGNFLLATRSREAEAFDEYQAASRLDPAFAAAVARSAYALALLRTRMIETVGNPRAADSLVRRGLALADDALRIDPGCSDGWMALGYLRAFADLHSLAGAEEAFQRAVTLDAANAEAWHQYGQILHWLGDDSAAVRAVSRALTLEPARAISLNDLAFYLQRDADRALVLSDSSIALNPEFLFAYFTRGSLYLRLHRPADALRDAEAVEARLPGLPLAAALRTSAYAMLGDTARARDAARAFLPPRADGSLGGAIAMLALGDTAWALEHIEHIPAPNRDASLWEFLRLPQLDALRSNPRFQRVYLDSRPPAARAP